MKARYRRNKPERTSLRTVNEQPKTETPKTDAPATGGETTPSKPESTAVEPKQAESKPTDAAAGQAPATGEAVAKEPAATTEKAASPKRQLTEEVRKYIRQRVAAEKIRGIFDKIEVQMKANAVEWKSHEAAKIHGETDLQKPPQLDFAGLAKQYGVTKGNTGEITRWDAQDKDIGKSIVLGFRQPFVNCVFDNLSKHSEIGKRSPVRSMTATDIFLFWKTKDIKETAAKWE